MASRKDKISKAGVPALLVVGALCAVALGAFGATLVISPAQPQSLREGSTVKDVEVEQFDFFDAHPVVFVLKKTEPVALTIQSSGRVTNINCVPGAKLASGTVPVTISDKPHLALSTSVPLFRDLRPGDRGADVDALLSELERLGTGIVADGVLGKDSLDVFSRLIFENGFALESFESIPYERVMWLPGYAVPVDTCGVQLGGIVESGDTFASAPGQLASASVDVGNVSALSGKRLVNVGELAIAVSDQGVVSDNADLEKLENLPAFSQATRKENPIPLEGTWRLVDPVSASSVPAMILTDVAPGSACVWRNGHGMMVEIIGSQLGQSLIRARHKGEEIPPRLSLDPPSGQAKCQ